MIKVVQKLRFESYLSAVAILAIDLLVSLFASVSSLLIINYLFAPIVSNTALCVWLAMSILFSGISFYLLRTFRSVIRHSTLREIGRFLLASLCKVALLAILSQVFVRLYENSKLNTFVLILDFFSTLGFLIIIRVLMVVVYDIIINRTRGSNKKIQNVLIYGVGNKSVSIVDRLKESPNYNVIGFLNPNTELKNYNLAGKTVYCYSDDSALNWVFAKSCADAVLYISQNDIQNEQDGLVKYTSVNGIKSLLAPRIDEVSDLKVSSAIREVKIEDLLGREEIKISLKEIKENFKGKTVLVTGAAGSIGSELCRQLATFGVEKLVLYDNAETPLHNLRLEFEDSYPDLNFVPVVGDIRIQARLDYVFKKYHPQVVFHAGAYKHVPLMEENPCEAVLVNTVGSRNVADKCIEYDVEKMVMISTDKAVNPANIMGCTERVAEI